jgi:hypothetical protein
VGSSAFYIQNRRCMRLSSTEAALNSSTSISMFGLKAILVPRKFENVHFNLRVISSTSEKRRFRFDSAKLTMISTFWIDSLADFGFNNKKPPSRQKGGKEGGVLKIFENLLGETSCKMELSMNCCVSIRYQCVSSGCRNT